MGDFFSKFKQKRLEKGLSLEEVSEKTNIRTKYLKAIEEGDFAQVKGEVFLKGFIKVYSNFLGFDTTEVIAEYEAYKKAMGPEVEEKEESLNDQLGKFVSNNRTDLIIKMVSVIVAILLVGLLIFAGFRAYDHFLAEDDTQEITESINQTEELDAEQDIDAAEGEGELTDNNETESLETETEEELENKEDDLVIEVEEPEQPEEPEEVDDTGVEDLAQNDTVETTEVGVAEGAEIEIEVLTIAETWYSVIVDGENVFQQMTSEGETYSFAGQNIEMTIGNAAGLEIVKGDEVFGPFGDIGDVLVKEFKAEE